MTDSVLTQHPPAVKVGGRRLSVSTKQKNLSHSDSTSAVKEEEPAKTDYPRPADTQATNEVPAQTNNPHHNEEEAPPKKEKQLKKSQDWAYKKVVSPPKHVNIGNKGHAVGIRIAQPAGKFGV